MKRLFEPGQTVTTFQGESGMVISKMHLAILRECSREGRKPGHSFSLAECHEPDYIQEIPVAFEDGTFDMMRATSIRRQVESNDKQRAKIRRQLDQRPGPNRAT